MSGIGGILNLDGREVKEEDLLCVQQALLHRGRDTQAIWRSSCLGLVHNLLEIDPEPPQPFFKNGCCLVMDGRLDNLSTLSKLLGRRSAVLRNEEHKALHPLEAILAVYDLWKEKGFSVLLGDFALALWDGRSQRLVLARDPIGMKPIYYWRDKNRLAFASEAKGILALPGVSCQPDKTRLKEFDAFRFRSMEGTFFEGITRLPPGIALVAHGSFLEKRAFWEPNPKRHIMLPNRDAYRTRFRDLFVDAVRCRLPQSGSVAIRLSGGLDSSAIAGVCDYIRKSERPFLSLFAISILSDLVPDERQYLGEVCRAAGMEADTFIAEERSIWADIERAIYHQEGPLFEAMDPWILHQHRLASERQARVVLGGDWGDQVMGSCAYLVDLLREGQWAKFWREFALFPKNEGGTYKDLAKLIFWYFVLPARISDRYEGLRYLIRTIALPWRPIDPGGPRFPLAAQREHYDGVFGIHSTLLLEMLDKMASQWGVEARLPFLDRRLVVFTMSIPQEENIRDGWGRRLEREALEEFLPRSIAARKDKGDFTDLEYYCLKQAGFHAKSHGRSVDLWREAIKDLWEEVWIRGNPAPQKGSTTRPALWSTAS